MEATYSRPGNARVVVGPEGFGVDAAPLEGLFQEGIGDVFRGLQGGTWSDEDQDMGGIRSPMTRMAVFEGRDVRLAAAAVAPAPA
jgi:hypothetical protein